jgi:hypothetical protein
MSGLHVIYIPSARRRGTQVVRERSAKPLCVGSIPTRASKSFNDCRVHNPARQRGRQYYVFDKAILYKELDGIRSDFYWETCRRQFAR